VHGSTAAPRWLVGAAPLIYHHQGAWGFGLLQGTRHAGFNEERRRSKNCLPSPAACPGEGERGTVLLFFFFFYFLFSCEDLKISYNTTKFY